MNFIANWYFLNSRLFSEIQYYYGENWQNTWYSLTVPNLQIKLHLMLGKIWKLSPFISSKKLQKHWKIVQFHENWSIFWKLIFVSEKQKISRKPWIFQVQESTTFFSVALKLVPRGVFFSCLGDLALGLCQTLIINIEYFDTYINIRFVTLSVLLGNGNHGVVKDQTFLKSSFVNKLVLVLFTSFSIQNIVLYFSKIMPNSYTLTGHNML